MDRKALPQPDITDFQNDYAGPENEIQKLLCEAFEKVLHLEKVGIHDDFYEMGGDSLSSIELISECALDGLNSTHVFRGRTPEQIAALYQQSLGDTIAGQRGMWAGFALAPAVGLALLFGYIYLRYPRGSFPYLLEGMDDDIAVFDDTATSENCSKLSGKVGEEFVKRGLPDTVRNQAEVF